MLFILNGKCFVCNVITYKTRKYNNYKYCQCGNCRIKVKVCMECMDGRTYFEIDHMDNCFFHNIFKIEYYQFG